METKDTLSLCLDLDEQEIQQLQKQANILKENSLNKLNALKTTIQHLSSSNSLMYYTFKDAFHRLFEADKRTFRRDFKEYTHMEAQTFKETIIQNINSIEQCIIERAKHEQELQNGLKRLNERKLQIQECKVQKVKASNASLGDNDCSRIVSDKENDQVEKADSNVTPDSPDMCDNEIQTEHNVIECDDERVTLANLIANLKIDIDENKTIQKQLKKANASLTQELKECKSTLAETSRTLRESNSIRDSCLVALQNKQTEFERYKAFNDRTIDYDKLERKLNETLGLLAQKEIDIKEGLKVKAYDILVVKEKHVTPPFLQYSSGS
ncbi:hypothetical protein Tco_0335451 [Tanacetum coccineum]